MNTENRILIYALFIFLEEANFHTKLKAVFADKRQFNELNKVLDQIEKEAIQIQNKIKDKEVFGLYSTVDITNYFILKGE